MQLCESCGACRENEWRLCPFCGTSLAITDEPASSDNERFDALAAAAETSSHDVLPSLMADDEDEAEDENLITAQDLAHLTGDGGPTANGWDSPAPQPKASSDDDATNDGIDAPVSKAVVFPLIAVALAAVAFVAYSIITASPAVRPDAVALIDQTTTTLSATTTSEPLAAGPGAVGVDLAEQAAWLCAGEQFGIARADDPSRAIFNDILIATRDGTDGWSGPADHVTIVDAVPPLIGCLVTIDGGEIDRCPTDDFEISRRSITWSYRVLQSNNGDMLGVDEGTATDLRSCDELIAEADGQDLASWSALPFDRFDQAAVEYTAAPHPQEACAPEADDSAPLDVVETDAPLIAEALSLHATFASTPDIEVTLPKGWQATDERPVQAVLCLELLPSSDAEDEAADTDPVDANADAETEDLPAEQVCETRIRVHAMLRNGQKLSSWDYVTEQCTAPGEAHTIPNDWWLSVVGPELGYELESSEGE